MGYKGGLWPRQKLVAVKAPVFSMSKLVGVDSYLGPEMKSTGEVMGIDRTFAPALFKAMVGAGVIPMTPIDKDHPRGVLMSVADRDKDEAVPIIKQFAAGLPLVRDDWYRKAHAHPWITRARGREDRRR